MNRSRGEQEGRVGVSSLGRRSGLSDAQLIAGAEESAGAEANGDVPPDHPVAAENGNLEQPEESGEAEEEGEYEDDEEGALQEDNLPSTLFYGVHGQQVLFLSTASSRNCHLLLTHWSISACLRGTQPWRCMKSQHCTGARGVGILQLLSRPLGKAPAPQVHVVCGTGAGPAGVKAKAQLETSQHDSI